MDLLAVVIWIGAALRMTLLRQSSGDRWHVALWHGVSWPLALGEAIADLLFEWAEDPDGDRRADDWPDTSDDPSENWPKF